MQRVSCWPDYSLETNSYHLTPESAPRFASGSNSLIAWAYDDGDFGQAAVVFDLESELFQELTGSDHYGYKRFGDSILVNGYFIRINKGKPHLRLKHYCHSGCR